MNILLIHPDIQREKIVTEGMFPSIGLNLLLAILKQRAHSVYILDPLMSSLIYRTSKLSIHDSIKQIITEKKIQVVGISTLLQTRFKAIEIAKLVKSFDSNIKVILGGPGASLLTKQFLECFGEFIDFVVIGEGEITLPALIGAIENNQSLKEINGIAYQDHEVSKQIYFSSPREHILDLDSIPFPDYSHYLKYLPKRKLATASILLSRGCEYNCSFCGTKAMWKDIRYRSVDNIIDEIKQLSEKYGVEYLRIHDDIFGINKTQTQKVLEEIIKSKIKLKLYAHSRVGVMDKEILKLFKYTGGESIYYGIESGSLRIRNLMCKDFTNEEAIDICNATKNLGIKLGVFLMFGYPTETISDIRQTYKLLELIEPDEIYTSTVKIQPGTKIYKYALDKKIISDDMWLADKREYFTFLNKEDEAIIKGYEILFHRRFSKCQIRTAFEKNNDLIYFRKDKRICSLT